MSNKLTLASAFIEAGEPHQAILAQQLLAKGMPEINLPKLQLFSPLAINSRLFGPSEVPAILIGAHMVPVSVDEVYAQMLARMEVPMALSEDAGAEMDLRRQYEQDLKGFGVMQ
jgi:hypothetical protein